MTPPPSITIPVTLHVEPSAIELTEHSQVYAAGVADSFQVVRLDNRFGWVPLRVLAPLLFPDEVTS